MLTARSVVAATVVIAVLSIVLAVVSLVRAPDSGGLGADSFGTRAHGFRALFEILTELKVPVRRQLEPPTSLLDRQHTLVFWAPHRDLVQLEPAYLKPVARWVRGGGRVVLAPAVVDTAVRTPMPFQRPSVEKETDILEELGLSQVAVHAMDQPRGADERNGRPEDESTALPSAEVHPGDIRRGDLETLRKTWAEAWSTDATPTRSVAIQASGTLAPLQQLVAAVEIPGRGLQVIDVAQSEPAGTVEFTDEDGTERTLVATYRLGSGEVVVVGDPALAQNGSIARQDNSVLAAHLFGAGGREVVFDEFYHGLAIRGNPLWLFTRRDYGMMTICLLIVMGLWSWRQSVFLGPPLESTGTTRRSIGEYVEAMARFLKRGRTSHPFLLREVRDGVLRAVRNDLGLPPGREGPEELTAVLGRRDPRRAKQLTAALASVDEMLSNTARWDEKQTLQVLRRMSACLSNCDIKPSGRKLQK